MKNACMKKMTSQYDGISIPPRATISGSESPGLRILKIMGYVGFRAVKCT